ncbi:MAG: homoserine O-acetyltransferase [Acidimicrobiales bacterium]
MPATGAWLPGDPPGDRRFVTITDGRPFALEGGGRLDEVVVAYETWGALDDAASNAVLVCHALTGDSHAAGPSGPGHPAGGWWDELIGPGRALDTDRYYVVCPNVLGGCQGSTGPTAVDPATGRIYGPDFPCVTIRDMVRVQARLAEHLGVGRWLTVVGGSMGGMQVLEWGAMFPRRVRSIIPLATTAAASPQQIAWSAVGRLAIVTDPGFRGGRYYETADGEGPWMGLAVAREIAQITYRSGEVFDRRFGREPLDRRRELDIWSRYQVEAYLDHHGQKLVRRFDANSYIVLNRSMDLHDMGRGRGGIAAALGRIQVPVMTASITSDTLYPPHQQQEIHDAVLAAGGWCRYDVIESLHGHDGFLIESEQLGAGIEEFLTTVEKSDDRV